MGRLNALEWQGQTVKLNGCGLALCLLQLPAGCTRPAARRHARQALRQMLGDLLARPAAEITLRESARGPIPEQAAGKLHLSLSYAADRCLIGLAEGRPIGVDIVRIEPLAGIEDLSRLYLPAASCGALLAAPASGRDARFALAWAQMEARSKCLGLALEEIRPEREATLHKAALINCVQPDIYRIALATLTLSSEHDALLTRKPFAPCPQS